MIGVILGYYWDNGKENGNYYILIGYIGVKLGKLGYVWEADGPKPMLRL